MSQGQNKNKGSQALLALGAAALAIPGIVSKAEAAAPATESSLDYKFSAYREADLDRNNVVNGSTTSRYEIDSHLFRYVSPVGENQELNIDFAYETMSGASPWIVMPQVNTGRPVQLMSGASIKEERKDIQASLKHFHDKQTVITAVAGFSDENDYQAFNVGAAVDYEQFEKQRTFSAGFGISDDHMEPTDGRTMIDRVDTADKSSVNMFVGISQIINARTVVQGSLSLAFHDGFLSDPYKKFWVVNQSNALMDSRPDKREPIILEGRLRHYVPAAKAALHLDYRYYDDDWDVVSHTFDASWYQNLPNDWQLTPSFRYYSQTQAYFYAPYYIDARSDGYGSSDYRLSPYGAISFRLKLSKDWGKLSTNLEWESYKASADYSLKEVELESPALVEFDILTLGLHWEL
ncbi:DUF3570 domain-containing protein [Spongiibacter sp. KMU-158]|uniref:DUF3570 domain-containing protein n=1 Tax=Spongiibacter pelagi TaxID=2760804 RepID=A0A927C191_9GAMM|nr:DUF3570 domain-containing protein [Spongiibacter pelagi]MBD2858879.1 DUF3570 domain-containing protein [Spongiibacter pelagi]